MDIPIGLEILGLVTASIVLMVAALKAIRLFDWLVIHVPRYKKCENPLVDDSAEDRYNEWVCRKNGCVTTASYYVGMPQATCRRCGGRNSCAADHVPKWRLPDRYEERK